MLGVFGMGFFYVPAIVSTIPAQSVTISPAVYLLEIGYVVLASAVFQYPHRLRGAFLGIAVIIVSMAGFAAIAVKQRYSSGEFDRPAIICFTVRHSNKQLVMPREFESLFTSSVLAELRRKGIGGEIGWSGSVNDQTLKSKLVVLVTSKVPSAIELRYPKEGTIFYLVDGASLFAMPSDIGLYPDAATLRADGMISTQDIAGGISSFRVYPW